MTDHPTPFVLPPSAVIASFNFTDLAEGVGIVEYFGFTVIDSVGETQNMGSQEVFSGEIEKIGVLSTAPGPDKSLDVDFDLSPFNASRAIRGNLFCEFTLAHKGSASNPRNAFAIIKVRKVLIDGTTEEEIASTQTETVALDLNITSGAPRNLFLAKIELPLTKFKIGEKLRITIEGWSDVATGDNQLVIGTDPKNRDADRIKPSTDDPVSTTNTKFFVPFELQI